MRHDPRGGSSAGYEPAEFTLHALSPPARASWARLPEVNRVLDIAITAIALLVIAPLVVAVAVAVKLESRGPVLYRCRRVGRSGRPFAMLKFRKMRDGVGGSSLTAVDDDRFTRIGGFLARTKLDEVPQLWNVLRGQMSLVGPRPEDPSIVALHRDEYTKILSVRPGITGLSQLAFAREAEVLSNEDRLRDYVDRILPQKIRLDRLYATDRTVAMDLRILLWTFAAVIGRLDVAVHRRTGGLNRRRRAGAMPVGQEAA
jgi:lipopolysaccharide/colanic/teichoic acid biosynthesis glycosyltransferase